MAQLSPQDDSAVAPQQCRKLTGTTAERTAAARGAELSWAAPLFGSDLRLGLGFSLRNQPVSLPRIYCASAELEAWECKGLATDSYNLTILIHTASPAPKHSPIHVILSHTHTAT